MSKGFKTLNYGEIRTGGGNAVPHVFHGEATVTSAVVRETGEGKVLDISAALGMDPKRLLSGELSPGHQTTDDQPWCSITLFGPKAEEYEGKLRKGDKIAFCGTPRENSWTSKTTGEPCARVVIRANRLVKLSCRNSPDGEPAVAGFGKSTQIYPRHDGAEGQNLLAELVMGNVKSVQPLRTVNGRDVLSFMLELPQPAAELWQGVDGGQHQLGAGDRRLFCSVWGKRAFSLMQKVVRSGAVLALTGSLRLREWNNEQTLNMAVQEISVAKWSDVPSGSTAPASATGSTGDPAAPVDLSNLMEDDEDDELPF